MSLFVLVDCVETPRGPAASSPSSSAGKSELMRAATGSPPAATVASDAQRGRVLVLLQVRGVFVPLYCLEAGARRSGTACLAGDRPSGDVRGSDGRAVSIAHDLEPADVRVFANAEREPLPAVRLISQESFPLAVWPVTAAVGLAVHGEASRDTQRGRLASPAERKRMRLGEVFASRPVFVLQDLAVDLDGDGKDDGIVSLRIPEATRPRPWPADPARSILTFRFARAGPDAAPREVGEGQPFHKTVLATADVDHDGHREVIVFAPYAESSQVVVYADSGAEIADVRW